MLGCWQGVELGEGSMRNAGFHKQYSSLSIYCLHLFRLSCLCASWRARKSGRAWLLVRCFWASPYSLSVLSWSLVAARGVPRRRWSVLCVPCGFGSCLFSLAFSDAYSRASGHCLTVVTPQVEGHIRRVRRVPPGTFCTHSTKQTLAPTPTHIQPQEERKLDAMATATGAILHVHGKKCSPFVLGLCSPTLASPSPRCGQSTCLCVA